MSRISANCPLISCIRQSEVSDGLVVCWNLTLSNKSHWPSQLRPFASTSKADIMITFNPQKKVLFGLLGTIITLGVILHLHHRPLPDHLRPPLLGFQRAQVPLNDPSGGIREHDLIDDIHNSTLGVSANPFWRSNAACHDWYPSPIDIGNFG